MKGPSDDVAVPAPTLYHWCLTLKPWNLCTWVVARIEGYFSIQLTLTHPLLLNLTHTQTQTHTHTWHSLVHLPVCPDPEVNTRPVSLTNILDIPQRPLEGWSVHTHSHTLTHSHTRTHTPTLLHTQSHRDCVDRKHRTFVFFMLLSVFSSVS